TLGGARDRGREGAGAAGPGDRARTGRAMRDEAEHKADSEAVEVGARRCRDAEGVTEVSLEEARRVAVRAQLLDGSARGVLSTVRRLGFLQVDTVSTVAPP